MKTQRVLIVANYHCLTAYLVHPDGNPEIIKQTDFEHDSQTHVPLVPWSEGFDAGIQVLGETISGILRRYDAESWALACPAEIADGLTASLPRELCESLVQIRPIEREGVDVPRMIAGFHAPEGAAELKNERAG